MRRFLAIVLLALLPLQFTWAAVASYCGHESQLSTGHFGHHEHQHHADASPDAGSVADVDGEGNKAAGGMDLDCGHCHGQCTDLLALSAQPSESLSTAPPSAATIEAGGAHAPTRPERPQWLRLA